MENEFGEFLLKSGLYDSINIHPFNINQLIELVDGKVKIDVYCKECKTNRVFYMKPIYTREYTQNGRICKYKLANELKDIQNNFDSNSESDWQWTRLEIEQYTRVITFPFKCSMDKDHSLDYIVRATEEKMIKIGQFPSISEITFPELKTYRKVIDDESLKQLRKAIGLASQGIGAGAYIYLRRIFEKILDKAANYAVKDNALKIEEYKRAKTKEKVNMLSDYLPEAIINIPQFYSIVSKGVHELSEEECIKYFPILKECIFMILRQWEQKRVEQESLNKLKSSISNIATEISDK